MGNIVVPVVCMYVCMVITYSRVWINRVRLPILLSIVVVGDAPTISMGLKEISEFSIDQGRSPDTGARL